MGMAKAHGAAKRTVLGLGATTREYHSAELRATRARRFVRHGLRCHWPARPAPYASDPVLVHRLVRLLHASFRPSVAGTPLRFSITSPPSGCEGDFHPRAVEHARHTKKEGPP